MTQDQDITTFLEKIHTIHSHHQKIAKLTGENFNLLKLLHMGHYEVKTHSPILADLLDPDGTHGQGDVFLKLFVGLINTKTDENFESFNSNSAIVITEKSIGEVTSTEGGRIDIHIQDSTENLLLIENKIYAQEQENQMARYYNYAKEKNKPFRLIYLTLYGSQATNISKDIADNVQQNTINLSYQSDIIQWLEQCRKEVATVPLVRESLTQYIHLLKDLTNQNTNDHMSQEIAGTILSNAKNYESFQILLGSQECLKTIFTERFIEALKNHEDIKGLGLELKTKGSLIKKYDKFWFEHPNWKTYKFAIGCGYNHDNFKGFTFGLVDKGEMEKNARERLAKIAKAELGSNGFHSTPNWPAWKSWGPPYDDWMKGNTLFKIYNNPEDLLTQIYDKLIILKKIADQFCEDEKQLQD